MTEKMTDQTTDTTDDQAAEDQATEQLTADQQDAEQSERSRGNAEAAKYRRQLREVEAERDAALAELDQLKRESIMREYHLEEQHLKVLNTTGTLEDFEQSVKAYRELHNPYVIYDSGGGSWSGNGGGDGSDSPSWSDAIKG